MSGLRVEIRGRLISQAQPRFIDKRACNRHALVWVTQRPTTPRQLEHLGVSDRGVITYREALSKPIDAVERGEDAPWLVKDEALNTPMLTFKGEDDLSVARQAGTTSCC